MWKEKVWWYALRYLGTCLSIVLFLKRGDEDVSGKMKESKLSSELDMEILRAKLEE